MTSNSTPERRHRLNARDLFLAGFVLMFLALPILSSGSCSPQCSDLSALALVATLFGGAAVCIASVLLGVKRALSAPPGQRGQVVRGAFFFKSSRNRKLAGAVLVLLILALAAYSLVSINRPEWVYDGAYATYSGDGRLSDGNHYSLNMSIRVVEYNNTMALVDIWDNLTSKSVSFSNYSAFWTSTAFSSVLNPFMPNDRPAQSYSTGVTIGNKPVSTTAYVFTPQGSPQPTAKVYLSIADHFPVAFWYVLPNDGSIVQAVLVRTNIPGLAQ